MAIIYDQHAKHFDRTSAAAVLRGSEHVANVTLRYPADGAGRLYAYVHWLGTEMVRGSASGGGYDKATAACADAVRNAAPASRTHDGEGMPVEPAASLYAFHQALRKDNGQRWADALRAAGFTVLEVV